MMASHDWTELMNEKTKQHPSKPQTVIQPRHYRPLLWFKRFSLLIGGGFVFEIFLPFIVKRAIVISFCMSSMPENLRTIWLIISTWTAEWPIHRSSLLPFVRLTTPLFYEHVIRFRLIWNPIPKTGKPHYDLNKFIRGTQNSYFLFSLWTLLIRISWKSRTKKILAKGRINVQSPKVD